MESASAPFSCLDPDDDAAFESMSSLASYVGMSQPMVIFRKRNADGSPGAPITSSLDVDSSGEVVLWGLKPMLEMTRRGSEQGAGEVSEANGEAVFENASVDFATLAVQCDGWSRLVLKDVLVSGSADDP